MLDVAYNLYSGTDTTLSLDEILSSLNITHLDFRNYLTSNSIDLPPVTKGLADEVLDLNWPKRKVAKKYQLTAREYDDILSDNLTRNGLSGNDKLDIRRRRQAGESVSSIANLYDVTESRIYQITRGIKSPRKARQTLTMKDKVQLAIKKKNGARVEDLAKEYGLTPNTVYVYLREVGSV